MLPRQKATDLLRIAARCAMVLREQMLNARIAVATGRAPLAPGVRIGEAVDRAAQLLDSTAGVVAPPGMGKSRLRHELRTQRLRPAISTGVAA